LVHKYEILFGDQDDGVLDVQRRLRGGGEKVLITFNASSPMGGIRFNRQIEGNR
jgi:hypothetical protein